MGAWLASSLAVWRLDMEAMLMDHVGRGVLGTC